MGKIQKLLIERKIGPVNWEVRDTKGKSKVIHHNLIKPVLGTVEATRTTSAKESPSQLNPSTATGQSNVEVEYCPLKLTSTEKAGLHDTLDKSGFRDNILQNNSDTRSQADIPSSPPSSMISTRSGRTVKPVIRLGIS